MCPGELPITPSRGAHTIGPSLSNVSCAHFDGPFSEPGLLSVDSERVFNIPKYTATDHDFLNDSLLPSHFSDLSDFASLQHDPQLLEQMTWQTLSQSSMPLMLSVSSSPQLRTVSIANPASASSNDIQQRRIKPLEARFKCDILGCSERFFQSRQLENHVKQKHAVWSCNVCPRSYPHRKSLWEHHQAVHRGIKHICNIANCSYSAAKRSNLKRHQERKHGRLPSRVSLP